MAMEFRSIDRNDLAELRSWHKDPELSRRTSFPTDEWFAHVTTQETVRCWMAVSNGEPVAMIQIDDEGSRGAYWDIAVRPDLRRQGIGTEVAHSFLSGPGRAYSVLVGMIAPDNLASLALSRGCGFKVSDKPDEDGFLIAIRQPETSAFHIPGC